MVRATRTRFKPYVDRLRKKIVGWSVSRYLEAPDGISTGAPPVPRTKATRRNFRNRKDNFAYKQAGWSAGRSKELNGASQYPD